MSTMSDGAGLVQATTYGMDDFERIRKFDAHVHLNVDDPALIDLARDNGFQMLTINVDCPEFPSIAEQRRIARMFAETAEVPVHWAATFSMRGFGEAGWTDRVAASIAEAKADGARGVKIWKDVGMSAKDVDGRLVMLDHPGLAPTIDHVRAAGLPLIGHQGEPHNCWLSLERMTNDCDRRYFRRRPERHMHNHPHLPGYEDLIAVRDRFLDAHPGLQYVGAHLASLEHDVERVAAFLDRFPTATVDLSSRISHLQYQSVRDRERVRAFFIRYQDRVLYGTDLTFTADADPTKFRRAAHQIWTSHWRYLATAESQFVGTLDADVAGLALPRDVIDKLYFSNAVRVFAVRVEESVA